MINQSELQIVAFIVYSAAILGLGWLMNKWANRRAMIAVEEAEANERWGG